MYGAVKGNSIEFRVTPLAIENIIWKFRVLKVNASGTCIIVTAKHMIRKHMIR